MSHTPGPWVFKPEIREIHTIYPDPTSQHGNGTPIITFGLFDDLSNASIIAAAPEMLKALETVMKTFAARGTEHLSTQQGLAIGRVMNALAKARGE